MQNYAENHVCRIQKQYIKTYKTSKGVGPQLQHYRTYIAEAINMQKNKIVSTKTNKYIEK